MPQFIAASSGNCGGVMPVLIAWTKAWLFNPLTFQTGLLSIDLRMGMVMPSFDSAVWPCTLPTNLTISQAAARFLEPAETAQPRPGPMRFGQLGSDNADQLIMPTPAEGIAEFAESGEVKIAKRDDFIGFAQRQGLFEFFENENGPRQAGDRVEISRAVNLLAADLEHKVNNLYAVNASS